MNETIISDIKVLVVTTKGVNSSAEAFNQLESKLPTLRNRKFCGCLIGSPENGIYRACVAKIDTDNPKEMGLDEWVIPGGRYMRAKIKDWVGKEYLIGETFQKMSEAIKVDHTRPYIEFYRSQKELVLLSPIL